MYNVMYIQTPTLESALAFHPCCHQRWSECCGGETLFEVHSYKYLHTAVIICVTQIDLMHCLHVYFHPTR